MPAGHGKEHCHLARYLGHNCSWEVWKVPGYNFKVLLGNQAESQKQKNDRTAPALTKPFDLLRQQGGNPGMIADFVGCCLHGGPEPLQEV